MTQHFKARAKKGYNYLNYDTEKKVYTTEPIDGVDYFLVRACDLREIVDDLTVDGYQKGDDNNVNLDARQENDR